MQNASQALGLILLLFGVFMGWITIGGVLLALWLEALIATILAMRVFMQLPKQGRCEQWRHFSAGNRPEVVWGANTDLEAKRKKVISVTDLPRYQAMYRLAVFQIPWLGILAVFVTMFAGGVDGIMEMGIFGIVYILFSQSFRLYKTINSNNVAVYVILHIFTVPVVLFVSLFFGAITNSLLVMALAAVVMLWAIDYFENRYLRDANDTQETQQAT